MSTMKFCRECNNILYPKEDKEQKILLYACRNCDHQEVAEINCVYRNEIQHAVGERTQVLQDVAADPTLPRTKSVRCAQCNHGEAVFFQATARGEEGMTLFFVCCNPNCGFRWRDWLCAGSWTGSFVVDLTYSTTWNWVQGNMLNWNICQGFIAFACTVTYRCPLLFLMINDVACNQQQGNGKKKNDQGCYSFYWDLCRFDQIECFSVSLTGNEKYDQGCMSVGIIRGEMGFTKFCRLVSYKYKVFIFWSLKAPLVKVNIGICPKTIDWALPYH